MSLVLFLHYGIKKIVLNKLKNIGIFETDVNFQKTFNCGVNYDPSIFLTGFGRLFL